MNMRSFRSSFAVEAISDVVGYFMQPGVTKQMSVMGALPQKDIAKIHEAFTEVVNSIDASLRGITNDASLNPVADQLKSLMGQCLRAPNSTINDKHVHIPKFRGPRSYTDSSLTGKVQEVFRAFDSYYAEKQAGRPSLEMDKPVAIVQMWDNLFYVMMVLLNQLKATPGEEAKKAIEAVEVGLELLIRNAKINKIMNERYFESLNSQRARDLLPSELTRQKRDRVIQELSDAAGIIFEEAKRVQRDLTVRESADLLTAQITGQANSVSEFFLRALGTSMHGTNGEAVLSMLAKGEAQKNVQLAENKKFTGTPIGNVVQRYAANRLSIVSTESAQVGHNKRSLFNNLIKQGALDVVVNVNEHNSFVLNVMNVDTTTNDASIVKSVADILNLLNIAVALEKDLLNHLEDFGPVGMLASGELQVRQACVDSVYNRAIKQYQTLMKNPYFAGVEMNTLASASSSQRITSGYFANVPKHGRSETRLEIGAAAFLGYAEASIFIGYNSAEERVIKKMANTHQTVLHASHALKQQIADLVKEDSVMPAFNLDSDLYYHHIALLCAHNPELRDEVIRNVMAIVPAGQFQEAASCTELKKNVVKKIEALDAIKTNFAIGKQLAQGSGLSFIPQLQFKHTLSGYDFNRLFNFDDISNIDNIIKKSEEMIRIKAALVELKAKVAADVNQTAVLSDLIDVVDNCVRGLTDLSEKMLANVSERERYERRLQAVETQHVRQLKAMDAEHVRQLQAMESKYKEIFREQAEQLRKMAEHTHVIEENLVTARRSMTEAHDANDRAVVLTQKMKNSYIHTVDDFAQSDIAQIEQWRTRIAVIQSRLAAENTGTYFAEALQELQNSMRERITLLQDKKAKAETTLREDFGILEGDLAHLQGKIDSAKSTVDASIHMVQQLLTQIEGMRQRSEALGRVTTTMTNVTTRADSVLRTQSIFSSYQDAKVDFLMGLIQTLLAEGDKAQDVASHAAFQSQIQTAMTITAVGKKTHALSSYFRTRDGHDLASIVTRVTRVCQNEGADGLKRMLGSEGGRSQLTYRGCEISLIDHGDRLVLKAKGKGSSQRMRTTGIDVPVATSVRPTRA